MNIYVVLEGTPVLGAAVDDAVAEEIADRGSPGRWSEWRDGPVYTDRRRGQLDGAVSQRIVRVPLAGMPDVTGLLNQEALAQGGIVAAVPEPKVTWDAPTPDAKTAQFQEEFQSTLRKVAAAAARLREREMVLGMVGTGGTIRAGAGEAWEVITRVVNSYLPEDHQTGPVERLYGVPIVKDESLPPNEVRFGKWVYMVGSANGMIPEGRMVRIDSEAADPFTNPPS